MKRGRKLDRRAEMDIFSAERGTKATFEDNEEWEWNKVLMMSHKKKENDKKEAKKKTPERGWRGWRREGQGKRFSAKSSKGKEKENLSGIKGKYEKS